MKSNYLNWAIPVIYGDIINYSYKNPRIMGTYAYDIEAGYVAYRIAGGKAKRFDGDVNAFARTLPEKWDMSIDYKSV